MCGRYCTAKLGAPSAGFAAPLVIPDAGGLRYLQSGLSRSGELRLWRGSRDGGSAAHQQLPVSLSGIALLLRLLPLSDSGRSLRAAQERYAADLFCADKLGYAGGLDGRDPGVLASGSRPFPAGRGAARWFASREHHAETARECSAISGAATSRSSKRAPNEASMSSTSPTKAGAGRR